MNDVFVYRPQNLNKYILIAVEKIIPCDAEIEGLGDMLPVTFIKLSDVVNPTNLDDINNAVFLPHDRQGEYRFMWFKRGFKKVSAQFKYIGNFPFLRPKLIEYDKDEGLHYCEAWHRLDICIEEGLVFIK